MGVGSQTESPSSKNYCLPGQHTVKLPFNSTVSLRVKLQNLQVLRSTGKVET